MTYDEIFEAYYTLYRTEATVPTSEDDEYKIGMPLANEAINRWASYDATYWKELFSTNLTSDNAQDTVTAADTSIYSCPSDMREAGGYVKLVTSTGVLQVVYPIIEPQEAQFRSDEGRYAYFTGDPNNGFELHLNGTVNASTIGLSIDYVYYKKATPITSGSSVTEMNDPYFIVHRMLASRFRGSRNPYYGSAKTDAEDILKTMKMNNDSGSWANPWKLPDNSGTTWGGEMF